jgi:hypothetical protein
LTRVLSPAALHQDFQLVRQSEITQQWASTIVDDTVPEDVVIDMPIRDLAAGEDLEARRTWV